MTQDVKAGKDRGRKPVDTPGYNLIGYEAVWAAIRELKIFTRAELVIHIAKNKSWSVNDNTVKDYLQRLVKGEFLTIKNREKRRGAQLYTYELTKDVGINAPRLKSDGTASIIGLGRLNLWRSMRILGEFDYRELAATASNDQVEVKETDSREYVKYLAKAGYFKQTKAANKHGGLARYRLLPSKITGPKAPQIQRVKQVYDPNLCQVMGQKEEVEEC